MLQPELPSFHDLVSAWPRYIEFPAFWAAGWLVSSTSVPSEWQLYVVIATVVGSTALLQPGSARATQRPSAPLTGC